MDNIFENIKFGDKFVTRGGKVAIFLHKVGTNGYLDDDKRFYRFGTDLETFSVNEKGMYNDDSTTTDCLDIVSKYKKPVDEEELQKMAEEDASTARVSKEYNYGIWYLVTETFKAGYRKAKEE